MNKKCVPPVLIGDKDKCCGCQACKNACPQNAISIVNDKYGFGYPQIDNDKCIGCGKCVHVCDFQKEGDANTSYPIKGYAVTHKDKGILRQCASGGAFSAIAEWVLSNNGFVFGCVWNDKMEAVHIGISSIEELKRMRGSKYVQSDVGTTYQDVKKLLKDEKLVLYTGTPCQIAGLKSFLGGREYNNLFTVDVICHGVPSGLVFSEYKKYLEQVFGGTITDFQFRSKRYGWGRQCQEFLVRKHGGEEKRTYLFLEESYFLTLFNGNRILRPSCGNCKYSKPERVSDMTIGDFWGYFYARIPFKIRDGLSCCLVNSKKMLDVLPQLNINQQEVDISLIINGNKNLSQPTALSKKWEETMNNIADGGFVEMANLYYANSKLRRFLGGIKIRIPQGVIDFVKMIVKKPC